MCFGDNDHLFDQPIYLHPVIKNGGAPIPEIIEQVRAIKTPKPFCIDQYIKNEVVDRVIGILERYR